MLLKFSKMHGLGNDFVVVDLVTQYYVLRSELIWQLADRHRGIGFDQLLVIEPPFNPEADFRYRIFNADGGEVGQCGNGARCVAQFVHDQRLTGHNPVIVETRQGLMNLWLHDDGNISVSLGVPQFAVAQIPIAQVMAMAPEYSIPLAETRVTLSALSLGNPHAVVQVEDVALAPLASWGASANESPFFPEGVNLSVVQVLNKEHIMLRVYERGVGETQACGSAACAAMIACHRLGKVADQVRTTLPGGDLEVRWQGGEKDKAILKGPATLVYEGKIQL